MAVTDAYGDAATYRGIFGLNDSSKDASILLDLTAISRDLDRRLGRFFTQEASPTAWHYPPATVDFQRTLFVDDIASKTGLVVKIDDNNDGTAEVTLAETTDFDLKPMNAGLGSEPQPWTQLYLPPRQARNGWRSLVEVTAIHGWPAIPTLVTRWTYHIAGVLRIDSVRATNRIAEDIDKAVDSSKESKTMLDELIERYAKPAWIFS